MIPRTLKAEERLSNKYDTTVLTSFPLLKKRRASKIDHTEMAKKFDSNFVTEAKI